LSTRLLGDTLIICHYTPDATKFIYKLGLTASLVGKLIGLWLVFPSPKIVLNVTEGGKHKLYHPFTRLVVC